VIDKASMMTSLDLADIFALAAARGAKVIIAGDTSQLQAVQDGGGMSLLAHRSTSPGNKPPAAASATATAVSWPSTTSTPGSAAATPSR
jgi:ATP-dependent exoDNAse (exonuclease V) alpha subunit